MHHTTHRIKVYCTILNNVHIRADAAKSLSLSLISNVNSFYQLNNLWVPKKNYLQSRVGRKDEHWEQTDIYQQKSPDRLFENPSLSLLLTVFLDFSDHNLVW